MFIAALALVAVLVVLFWTVADHAASKTTVEPAGPVFFDQAGRFIAATEELPVFKPGRHRARRWSR